MAINSSAIYSTTKNRELLATYEGLAQAIPTADIKSHPEAIFESNNRAFIMNYMMDGIAESLAANDVSCPSDDSVIMECYDTDTDTVTYENMTMVDAHVHNLEQLLENSLADGKKPAADLRNLNELTPLDAFIPISIIRSYLPLSGKELVPYVVPQSQFVRMKELRKYIVTKDGNSYLRPDVYNNMDAVREIIAAGKGRPVTNDWFPMGEEVSDGTVDDGGTEGATTTPTAEQYMDSEGVLRKIPTNPIRMNAFDLLEASGGNRNIGEYLSPDVYINAARGVVTTKDGATKCVEVGNLNIYYDLASYTPQRSISATITYEVHEEGKEPEKFVDKIYGDYDDEKATFDVVSSMGYTTQVQFGGNLSNKNNAEYIMFKNDFKTYQHVIPDGIRSNFPITYEDVDLYKRTANIDIVANAVNEMNEIFTNLEDSSVIAKFDLCWNAYLDKTDHQCYRFEGKKVTWKKEVDFDLSAANRFFKLFELIQDDMQFSLENVIADIRTVCGNENFKIRLGCHPNIARLFVGEHHDWKIQPGMAIADNIRVDYNMGIYTANGNTARLVSTQKFKEEDGIRILVYPTNEENFMTWKHFKRALYFDKNHHISEMPNNPNIMGVATFYTHAYIPFQVKLVPKNYK